MFEIWGTCQRPTTSIKRGKDIETKINKMFKKNKLPTFKKNQKVFDILSPFQSNAIKNAKSIIPKYDEINWNEKMSKKGNPSTSIHFLVGAINTLIGNNKI